MSMNEKCKISKALQLLCTSKRYNFIADNSLQILKTVYLSVELTIQSIAFLINSRMIFY